MKWSSRRFFLSESSAAVATQGSNDGLTFNLRSVVAAAVFIVCRRSPAPVRDQAVGRFRSRGGCQIDSMVQSRGGCQIELHSLLDGSLVEQGGTISRFSIYFAKSADYCN
ncbi:uncharacterized protein LOC124672309 [Lolium rigidum]|uniref:uncharacterized protein LOC124672309 n=1 Tax=Lolium rigidum TaxID=89674 RepID=UPI001F5D5950|nr:uncharacterized protein LOC124672309 [Lolium rigidum]